MIQNRVNRPKAKLNFMKTQYATVKSRWAVYSKKYNYTTGVDRLNRATGWRSNEKKRLQEIANDKAQKEIIEETVQTMKEIYKPTAEELWVMHKALIWLMTYGIQSMNQRASRQEILNPKEIKDYWDMLKWEKLEPTRVSKVDGEFTNNWPAVIRVSTKVNNIIWS